VIRTLIVFGITTLASVALSMTAGPAYADDWCQLWHGTDYCQQQINHTPVRTRGELREKDRPCATAWADRRRNCEGQA